MSKMINRTFMGHPRGLVICFTTELWERFSYYGMRALLIFYLTKHFLFSDQKAYLIYGAYTAMIYVTPVIGGIIADRYLGARKAVTLGAILLVIGHFGMALEGPQATVSTSGVERDAAYLQIFYLSLAFIITGTGFLKSNISTIVGALYTKDDPRRDGGFTIFYMGINLGAFASAITCGWLGETYGWRYGFGAAGIGMLLGLFVFLKGQGLLEGHAEPPCEQRLKEPLLLGISREMCLYASSLVGVFVVYLLIQHQALVGNVLVGFGGVMLAVVLAYSFLQCNSQERDRMLVASVLIVFSVLFWSLFEQAGSSLNVFADRLVDRKLFGWEIPASVFQSLNALFIFVFAPLFAWLWLWLAKKGLEPSTPVKFSLAIFLVGLGFLLLVFGASTAESGVKPSMIWLVVIYFLHTMGELCLSPVGLSMITKLSVARVVGMMMGVWFLAVAAANYMGGLIAAYTGSVTEGGVVRTQSEMMAVTLDVYSQVGWLAVAVALVLLVLSPFLYRRMHGVR
jgi:POT family proton-dependent oligopeptide transporter